MTKNWFTQLRVSFFAVSVKNGHNAQTPLKWFHTLFFYSCVCCLIVHTTSVRMHACAILHTGLHGAGEFVLLHFTVKGTMCPIGEGGHAGLHAAAGRGTGRCSPPRVSCHPQPLATMIRPWEQKHQRVWEKNYKNWVVFWLLSFLILQVLAINDPKMVFHLFIFVLFIFTCT